MQVTDALWMDNSKHAVYSTSLRTLHFFDASASVHYEEYRAFGFKSERVINKVSIVGDIVVVQ